MWSQACRSIQADLHCSLATAAEQYRFARGKLESRQQLSKRFNSTTKCHPLSRSLVQIEEGDIFGDSDEKVPLTEYF